MKLKLPLPKLRQILWLILLFIYIYAPPFNFLPLGINKLIAPIAVVGLLFWFKSATLKVLQQKHVFMAICLMIVTTIYAFIIDTSTIYPNDLAFSQTNTFSQAMVLVEVLPLTLFFSIYGIRKLKFTLANLLSSLVIIATIQSLIAIIMLLLPNLRMFVLTTVLNYDPSDSKIFRPDLFAFRSFGFSQDILFSLSIVQGIAVAAILCLCLYNFTKYKYSLLLIVPLLLSIALNARVGFVPIILFTVITLLFNLFRLRIYLIAKFISFSVISSLIIYLTISNFAFSSELDLEKNIGWVTEVFIHSKNFAQGEDSNTGNFGTIQNRFLHLPDSEAARIFGEGRYVFNNKRSTIKSDTGYVRRIYFGGYMYSILAYGALIYLFVASQGKTQLDAFKPLFYTLLFTALLSHFKGDIFLPIPGFRVIFLIFLFTVSERRLKQPQLNRRFIPWYPHETSNFRL
ncbi:MAG: hypothetical protein AAGE84_09465 [Cyanobacteria bacterium P01_G01_bin.39]